MKNFVAAYPPTVTGAVTYSTTATPTVVAVSVTSKATFSCHRHIGIFATVLATVTAVVFITVNVGIT